MDWISVENERPPLGQDIIIYHADTNKVLVGCFLFDSDIGSYVSHWMPFPCPPSL